jgi:hypothetical protein
MPQRLGEKVLVIVMPVMFTWAVILNLATSLAAGPDAALRPLLVGAVVALAVFGVCLALTRHWSVASLFAAGLILFSGRQTLAGLAMLTLAAWLLAVSWLRRKRGSRATAWPVPRFIARAAAIFSIALVAVAGWNFVAAVRAGEPTWSEPTFQGRGVGGPSVYVLLLDGYPRNDTLKDTFGIDNSGFTDELERLGFDISSNARANYNKTWLTLASMFNGTYVDRMLADSRVPTEPALQVRWLSSMIERAAILDAFRDRGYAIKTVPTSFTTTRLSSADEVASPGGLSEVEARLISLSPWSQIAREPVLDFLTSQVARSVSRSLELTTEFARDAQRQPQLVFTHVHSPHTPFVLHPEGSPPPSLPACAPTLCSLWSATSEEMGLTLNEFTAALAPQLEELNRQVLMTIEQIVELDPGAIVVVMSDHGMRYSFADIDEHFRILLAARMPEGDALFPEDESPINVLRAILGRVGEDLSTVGYERWNADWIRMLDMARAE